MSQQDITHQQMVELGEFIGFRLVERMQEDDFDGAIHLQPLLAACMAQFPHFTDEETVTELITVICSELMEGEDAFGEMEDFDFPFGEGEYAAGDMFRLPPNDDEVGVEEKKDENAME